MNKWRRAVWPVAITYYVMYIIILKMSNYLAAYCMVRVDIEHWLKRNVESAV